MKSEFLTVLDLGSASVRCLIAGQDAEGEVQVKAIAVEPVKAFKRGVLVDVDAAANAIRSVLHRAHERFEGEVNGLVVSVGGAHLEGMNAQGFKPIVPSTRLITYQDVLEVVQHSRSVVLPPDREQIQALPREFRVDGIRGVKRPIGMAGGRLEVVTYLVTGQTAALQNLEKAAEAGGAKVEQMVLSPLAAGIGALTQQEMDLGAVLVDIGHGTTHIAVFSQGSISHSACIPVGSGHVTSDLVNLLRCSPEEADRLKLDHGCAMAKLVDDRDSISVTQLGQAVPRPMQRRVMCEIIEARMREIARMTAQQVDKSGLVGTLPAGVVLTGGGALMPGTAELFTETLKHLPARRSHPVLPKNFKPDPGIAVSLGLARFAFQCFDEIAPANGVQGWKDRVRSLFSLLAGR